MNNLKLRFGDKYEVIKNSTSKFNTNHIALISIFLIISSFSLQFILENSIVEKIISLIIYRIIWFISLILPLFYFLKKLFKYKEVDIYLMTLILFIIASFLYL
jgi:magnesium-transporting ATPase (P-type)